MTDQKIIPMFPTDEDLLSWVRNQQWVLKNSNSLSNDMVTMPAGRIAYALQRLEEILAPLCVAPENKPEFEPRGPRGDLKKPEGEPKKPRTKKEKPVSIKPGDRVLVKNQPDQKNNGVSIVGLKPNEKRVLDAIKKSLADGITPTYRGIAAEIGTSSHNGIHVIVKRLAEFNLVSLVGQGKNKRIALPPAA